ncbi:MULTISPECIES: hypothetical protein [unclassified Spiroplasma]|uniref:hypothetical protein n=1 Tax=unclassified Spiroplasma TaxID=2637901 RepID=UPI00313AF172
MTKKVKKSQKKKITISNNFYLKLSISFSILIIISSIGFTIFKAYDWVFEYNPYNKDCINFSKEIDNIFLFGKEHKFFVAEKSNEQNFLTKDLANSIVKEFNERSLVNSLSSFNYSLRKEFLDKLNIKKDGLKFFYEAKEIKYLKFLPVRHNMNSYGVVNLSHNNYWYNLKINYLYQIVIYTDEHPKPIILNKRSLFTYEINNIDVKTLIQKYVKNFPSFFNLNNFINNHFLEICNYDVNYIYQDFQNQLEFKVYYNTQYISSLKQLDNFSFNKQNLLYIKLRNLQINLSKTNINFNIKELPKYEGRKQIDNNPSLPPSFLGTILLTVNDQQLEVKLKFQPQEIIIFESETDNVANLKMNKGEVK